MMASNRSGCWLWLAALLPALGPAQQPAADPARLIAQPQAWTSVEVGDGVWLRQRWFAELFGAPQSLTLLEFPLDPKTTRLDVASHGELKRTSQIAEAAGALAAVNGGFYDTKNGNPVGLLRLDGELHNPANPGQGSLGIDRRGRLHLMARPAGDWPTMVDALGAGPMLLRDGKVLDHGERQRTIRHPRTAIGKGPGDRVVLLTVDGRTEQAGGMSFEELATTLAALGCSEALNLDGGGSSTLWVAGRGVCNFPCDNKTYDHAGERAVANSVHLFAPAVLVVDDDEAELTGADWEQRGDGRDVQGADFAWVADGDGRVATFRARLPFPGRWRVLAAWPRVGNRPAGRLQAVLGEATREVDARSRPGTWIALGELEAAADRDAVVVLRGIPGQALAADAVRFVQVR